MSVWIHEVRELVKNCFGSLLKHQQIKTSIELRPWRVVEDVVEVRESRPHDAPGDVGALCAEVLGQVEGGGVGQAAAVRQAEGVVQQRGAVHRGEGVLRNMNVVCLKYEKEPTGLS